MKPYAEREADDEVETFSYSVFKLAANVGKFQDGRHSDFTITCGAREWKVHRFILSASSQVLEKSCYGGFKEGVEAKLNLSVYSEDEVEALVTYIYTCKYTAPGSEDTHDADGSRRHPPGALPFHLKMSIIGNYFDIPGLENLARAQAMAAVTKSDGKDLIEAATITASAPDVTACILREIEEKACEHPLHISYRSFHFFQFQIVAANPALASGIAKIERENRLTPGEVVERLVCTREMCEVVFDVDLHSGRCRKGRLVDLLGDKSYCEWRRCIYCGEEGLGLAKFLHRAYWPEDFDEERDGWLYGEPIKAGQDGRGWQEKMGWTWDGSFFC